MKTKPTDRMWALLHGELSETEERELLDAIEADDDLLREFHARNELDLVLTAVQEEAAGSRPVAAEAPQKGRLIAFPSWPRMVQAVAVAASVAVVVGIAIRASMPGPLRWERTQIALLERPRGASPDAVSSLDSREVKRACARLQETVENRHAATAAAGQREPARWEMRISVSEHVGGALAVHVEGRIGDAQAFGGLADVRYENYDAFEGDLSRLAATIVDMMQRP